MKKKQKLDNETKIKLLNEFGTTDKKEIEEIIKKLDMYRTHLRAQNLSYAFSKDYIKNNYLKLVHMLIRRYAYIAKERNALHLKCNDLTPTELIISKIDEKILLKQLKQKSYTKEQAITILNNIASKYKTTNCDVMANDIDFYKIDKDLNVQILPAKERYNITLCKLNVKEYNF